MLHSISRRERSVGAESQEWDFLLCSFEATAERLRPSTFATMRALMQVNREARKAVLGRRVLQRFHSSLYTVKVFPDWLWQNFDVTLTMLQNCFFVNPNIDMFFFRQVPVTTFANESCLHQMKRIAIDINGPRSQGDGIYAPVSQGDALDAPSYDQLFARTTIRDLGIFPSLETIYLVLDVHVLRRIYAHTEFARDNELEYDEENEPGSDNDSDTDWFIDWDNYLWDGDELFYCWLCEFPMDQHDFHHIGPESNLPFRTTVPCLFRQQASQIEITFQDWADKMISSSKEDAEQSTVDVRMVMDILGEDVNDDTGTYFREVLCSCCCRVR